MPDFSHEETLLIHKLVYAHSRILLGVIRGGAANKFTTKRTEELRTARSILHKLAPDSALIDTAWTQEGLRTAAGDLLEFGVLHITVEPDNTKQQIAKMRVLDRYLWQHGISFSREFSSPSTVRYHIPLKEKD